MFTYLGLHEMTTEGTSEDTGSEHAGLDRLHLMRLQEAETSTMETRQTQRTLNLLILEGNSQEHVASEQETHFG